jgi:hypothetical protein
MDWAEFETGDVILFYRHGVDFPEVGLIRRTYIYTVTIGDDWFGGEVREYEIENKNYPLYALSRASDLQIQEFKNRLEEAVKKSRSRHNRDLALQCLKTFGHNDREGSSRHRKLRLVK